MDAERTNTALDATVASLQHGVEQLGVEAALPEIEGWEQRLAESGNPHLTPIAENLGALRAALSARDFDPAEVGRIMSTLGELVQRLANTEDVQIEVTDKLSQLSVMLSSEGDSLSGPVF